MKIRAQVNQSQLVGHYLVALSGDGFESFYEFGGTPDEIRALLAEIERRLVEVLGYEGEAAG